MSSTVCDDKLPRGPVLEATRTGWARSPYADHSICWNAIFGGAVLVIALQMLLGLLGAGVGATLDTASVGGGAGSWTLFSSVIALAFGGYAASWLAGVRLRWAGVLHGLITWGVAVIVTAYIVPPASGGGAAALSSVAAAPGSGLALQPAGTTLEMLQQQAQAFLQAANSDPASMSPHEAQNAIANDLAAHAKGGPGAIAAKSHIVAIIAAQQHISTDRASKQFDDAQSRLQFARDQAAQTAKNAAGAIATSAAKTAFAAFAGMVIGACAAAYAGSKAVQRRTDIARRMVRSADRPA